VPRIRSIKPQFWGHPLPPRFEARLLYMAMWNWADDYGVGEANAKALAGFAFPYDDIDGRQVEELFAEIALSYDCVFYVVDGRPYYCLQSWKKHQSPKNPGRALNPRPELAERFLYQGLPKNDLVSTPGPTPEPAPLEVVGSREEVVGSREETPLRGVQGVLPQSPLPEKKDTARGTRLPEDWQPTDAVKEDLKIQYPHLKLGVLLEEFRDYWISVPGQRGRKADWDRTFRNWVRKGSDRPPERYLRNGSAVSPADTKVRGWQNLGKEQDDHAG
jgi:hypothetical protein